MTTHWKALVGVTLIFVFGFFSGVLCSAIIVQHKMLAFFQHPLMATSAALEKRLTGNLHLDANQQQQVHEYFMANLRQRMELQTQIQPQVRVLNMETYRQVDSILRPDQLDRFHQNIEEFRKHFGKYALDTNADTSAPPPH